MGVAAAAEAVAGVTVSDMSVTSSGHGNSYHCSRCYGGSGHGSSDKSWHLILNHDVAVAISCRGGESRG